MPRSTRTLHNPIPKGSPDGLGLKLKESIEGRPFSETALFGQMEANLVWTGWDEMAYCIRQSGSYSRIDQFRAGPRRWNASRGTANPKRKDRGPKDILPMGRAEKVHDQRRGQNRSGRDRLLIDVDNLTESARCASQTLTIRLSKQFSCSPITWRTLEISQGVINKLWRLSEFVIASIALNSPWCEGQNSCKASGAA
jgi:hypothetical protein